MAAMKHMKCWVRGCFLEVIHLLHILSTSWIRDPLCLVLNRPAASPMSSSSD